MSIVKLACAATVVAVAAARAMDMPEDRRIVLWTNAEHFLGIQPQMAAPAKVFADQKHEPSAQLPVSSGSETIRPDRYGQYNFTADVEGQRFPVLIDTGAYMVSLTSEVAGRLGYYPSPSEFDQRISTANGTVAYAKMNLRELRLGTLVVRDVPALIAPPGALFRTLLGMSFLKKLSSFRTNDGNLILQQ